MSHSNERVAAEATIGCVRLIRSSAPYEHPFWEGHRRYDRAMAVQAPWARSLAENLTPEQITSATIALGVLTSRLEEELEATRKTAAE